MITVEEFANGFSSIWRELTPTSERVIRRLNLSVDRFFAPLNSDSSPARHALINEIGFELSRELSNDGWPPSGMPDTVSDGTYQVVRERLVNLAGVVAGDLKSLSLEEGREALSLGQRIIHFFLHVQKSRPDFFPAFPGCGFLYASEGDIKTETTIFEVKSGNRQFRSPDLRQLLVHSAANFAAGRSPFGEIGLLNPRMGTYFVWDIRAVCFELGGISPQELFQQLIFHVSSGSISR